LPCSKHLWGHSNNTWHSKGEGFLTVSPYETEGRRSTKSLYETLFSVKWKNEIVTIWMGPLNKKLPIKCFRKRHLYSRVMIAGTEYQHPVPVCLLIGKIKLAQSYVSLLIRGVTRLDILCFTKPLITREYCSDIIQGFLRQF